MPRGSTFTLTSNFPESLSPRKVLISFSCASMVIVGSGWRKIHQKARRTRLHQSSARTGEEVIGSGHSLERGEEVVCRSLDLREIQDWETGKKENGSALRYSKRFNVRSYRTQLGSCELPCIQPQPTPNIRMHTAVALKGTAPSNPDYLPWTRLEVFNLDLLDRRSSKSKCQTTTRSPLGPRRV